MKRSQPLKRSPFKSRSVLTRSLRPESKKTHAKMRERTAFKRAFLAENPKCQVRATPTCKRFCADALDLHEPYSCGRGGPINDHRNTVGSCRACHRWIHENPEMAEVRGLLIPSHDGPAWLARGGCLQRKAVRK